MNVALYARVSSDRQDTDLSISAQLKALREWASRNGHEVVREYVDEAESGRSIDRPGFKRMIAAARQKPPRFDTILVWKLSRFARNREDSIVYKSLLRKHGVQVISVSEPLEDTPSGKLLEGIIEVIDEFYSANLSQDVVRGMRESASRGYHNGGRTPYGFKRVSVQDGEMSRSKLAPDPATAPVVQRIFRECLQGRGLKEIAGGLNRDGVGSATGGKWGTTSVHGILQNEAYAGVMVWDKRKKRQLGNGDSPPVRVENAWPAIIDAETFAKAQEKLGERAPRVSHPRTVHSEYALSGLIRCRHCGAAMIGHAVKSGRHFYYMCGNARRRGRDVCDTPLLPKAKIEGFIVDQIRQHILTNENLHELVGLVNDELRSASREAHERIELLQLQMGEVEGRLGKLYDALETGEYKPAQLSSRINALFDRKLELERAKSEAEESLLFHAVELTDEGAVQAYVEDLRSLLENSEIMERKAFLRSFVKAIDVDRDEVTVRYTLPVFPDGRVGETVGVLPSIQNGSPSRIRTYNLAVNSRPLYR